MRATAACLLPWFLAAAAPLPVPPTEAEIALAAAKIPVSAFFSLPAVRQPRLSPDGTKIAFLFPQDGRLALGVFDRATRKGKLVLRGRDEGFDSFVWKGNDRIAFLADYQGNESYFSAVTDLGGKKVRRLTESYGSHGRSQTTLTTLNWLSGDPDHVVHYGMRSDDNVPLVTKVNVRTGRRETLFAVPQDDPEAHYETFLTDGQAQVRFAFVRRMRELRLLYRTGNTDPFRLVHQEPIGEFAQQWGRTEISTDGRRIYVVGTPEGGVYGVREYDGATGRFHPPVFVPSDMEEITDLLWSVDGNTLTGVTTESVKVTQHWLDEGEAAIRDRLQHAFPGFEVRVVSRSADDRIRLVLVRSDRNSGVYFVYERDRGHLDEFKVIHPALDPRFLRPMEPIAYRARDGLEIHGYLTRPWNSTGRAGPLVLLPHGGPFGERDSWGFDSEVQFLASRGYAVLQVNFRGSGGYGAAFVNRGRQQWGRAMQDDLTDAVRWAVAQGIADPKRVAIYGASYGGYAALVGAALTPELYCCAVNYVGVADLEITGRVRGADTSITSSEFDFRREWVGATKELRDAVNPVRLVDRIQVPTLHAYGRNDPRVPYDHWERLERQLKKHRKPYEILFNKRAGHGFEDEKDSIAFHQALEKFLARHLGVVTAAE